MLREDFTGRGSADVARLTLLVDPVARWRFEELKDYMLEAEAHRYETARAAALAEAERWRANLIVTVGRFDPAEEARVIARHFERIYMGEDAAEPPFVTPGAGPKRRALERKLWHAARAKMLQVWQRERRDKEGGLQPRPPQSRVRPVDMDADLEEDTADALALLRYHRARVGQPAGVGAEAEAKAGGAGPSLSSVLEEEGLGGLLVEDLGGGLGLGDFHDAEAGGWDAVVGGWDVDGGSELMAGGAGDGGGSLDVVDVSDPAAVRTEMLQLLQIKGVIAAGDAVDPMDTALVSLIASVYRDHMWAGQEIPHGVGAELAEVNGWPVAPLRQRTVELLRALENAELAEALASMLFADDAAEFGDAAETVAVEGEGEEDQSKDAEGQGSVATKWEAGAGGGGGKQMYEL